MTTRRQKLLTILVSDAAEDSLTAEIMRLGATGCSISPARGHGVHGDRPSKWQGGNVRIEVIGDDATVNRILERLEERYLPTQPAVAWIVDVDAWPPPHFAR